MIVVSQRYRRQTQRSTVALPVTLLDEPAQDVPKVRFNTSFDPNQSWAIANVHVEGSKPEAVGKYLFDKHHIFVTPIVHEEFQGIRITPNVYTTLGELDRFREQMELIARKSLPP